MVVKGLWTWRKDCLLLLIIGGALIVERAVGAPSCKDGQKLRTDSNGQKICCNTVVCNTSQDFGFCSADQGYDFCKDCPPGTYSNDIIKTAIWDQDSKVYVCVPKPKCNADEVILVGNGCQCNLGNGNFGRDPNNCQLDNKNCKDTGSQLDLDGNCIECPDNKFKPESGQYGLCRDKRRCKEDEEEIDSGSKDRDRQCQKIRVQTTSVPTPTTEPTKQENTTHSDMQEKEESLKSWVVAVIAIPVCLVVGIVVLCIVLKRKYIRKCFGNIQQRICSKMRPSEGGPPANIEERQRLMGGVRNGIPVVNNVDYRDTEVKDIDENLSEEEKEKNVQNKPNGDVLHRPKKSEKQNINGEISTNPKKKINSDKHETIVKEQIPTEELRPPPEVSVISTEKQGPSVQGIMVAPFTETSENEPAPLGSSINDSNNSSNLESNTYMFQTLTGPVRQPHIAPQPVISIHERRNSDTTPKSAVPDSEFTTAPEPGGNLPHSDLIQNLQTVTQPEEQAVTPDGATGNASAQTNNLIKEDDNRGNRTEPAKKPVATVIPMIQMPQNPSNVATDMHDQGQGFTASPTTDMHDQGQGFTASPTTAGGIDLQSPTPEFQGSYKVIANAPYGELPLTVDLSAIGEDINESQECINDGNIGIESRANNNVSTLEGDAIQSNPTDTSAENNQESIDDYVGVAGIRGGGDEIVDTESQAVGQGPNIHTTSSGNPLAAPSQDEASSNEPLLQGNVDNGESDEQGGERQRLFEC